MLKIPDSDIIKEFTDYYNSGAFLEDLLKLLKNNSLATIHKINANKIKLYYDLSTKCLQTSSRNFNENALFEFFHNKYLISSFFKIDIEGNLELNDSLLEQEVFDLINRYNDNMLSVNDSNLYTYLSNNILRPEDFDAITILGLEKDYDNSDYLYDDWENFVFKFEGFLDKSNKANLFSDFSKYISEVSDYKLKALLKIGRKHLNESDFRNYVYDALLTEGTNMQLLNILIDKTNSNYIGFPEDDFKKYDLSIFDESLNINDYKFNTYFNKVTIHSTRFIASQLNRFIRDLKPYEYCTENIYKYIPKNSTIYDPEFEKDKDLYNNSYIWFILSKDYYNLNSKTDKFLFTHIEQMYKESDINKSIFKKVT